MHGRLDPDALRDALDRWTDEGVIDESTADQIRSHEARHSSDVGSDTRSTATDLLGDRRLVAALALMGGVLVAVGVGALLVGPITDAVSGSVALVAAGVTLLVAGLGAERGRRTVLARMG